MCHSREGGNLEKLTGGFLPEFIPVETGPKIRNDKLVSN